jgi:hypothetical protein
MIIVQTSNDDERERTIEKCLAEGNFPIVCFNNVLIIGDRNLALLLFQRSVEMAVKAAGKDMTIMLCQDAKGRHCLSIEPNKARAVILYGINPKDFGDLNLFPLEHGTIQ